ncbi:MAG: Methyl-accepting chemotaxis protein McpB [Syntrophorhabdus sp. PtaU1.Bin050]|nr:MAG: Methyl-accepting chemotaxis protein McpB [Syntrophorhabdus sp. PtaU1.Bin050]
MGRKIKCMREMTESLTCHMKNRETPRDLPGNCWADELSVISKNLGFLTTSTEDEFLVVGDNLGGIYHQASEISAELSTMVNLMSGSDISDSIGGLRNILDHMGSFMDHGGDKSKVGSETIKDLHMMIQDLMNPVSHFKKIVKILRILSISTKIESAQLDQEISGFITLAEDVERLSLLVDSKSANIMTNAKSLENVTSEAFTNVLNLEKRQEEQVRGILDNLKLSLLSLVENNESSSHGANLISSESEEVSRHIGEVVASMQSHDITRQKIEHVQEVMDNLAARLDVYKPEGRSEPGENDTTGLVREVGDLCELQIAQLNDSKRQLVSAVGKMKDNLTHIARKVSGMCRNIRGLAGATDEVSDSFLSDIEADITSVIASLKQSVAASQELALTLEGLLGIVGDMSSFVNDIEEIGSEIELIALNARVKAAHTGAEGATLGVIAEAIQKLSFDANTHTSAISGLINRIAAAAEGLYQRINVDINGQILEADRMVEDLNGLVGRLRDVNGEILVLLNKIDRSGQDLGSEIERIVSGITVQDQFVTRIDGATAGLESILSLSREIAPPSDAAVKTKSLIDLEQKYTMESERKVHRSYAISGTDGQNIPLDPVLSGTGAENLVLITSKAETPDEFGDNVELF